MESSHPTARLVSLVKRISAAQSHDANPTPQPANRSSIPGFEMLGRYTSIWRPKPIHNKRRSRSLIQSPPLIIFCSGRRATPKTIAKYTEKYKYLYPEAEILLIESPTSSVSKDVQLETAIEVVKRHIQLYKLVNTKGIVIHVASNGGAYIATRLVRELARAKMHVPLEAMVLDCSPGKTSTSQSIRAALPENLIMRILGSWAVYAFYGMNILVKVMLPLPDQESRTQRDLNDDRFFDPREGKRLYLYSEADVWIGYESIGRHADEALALGYDVRREVFVKAGHCSLTFEDGWRYWRAVQGVVEEDKREVRMASSDEEEVPMSTSLMLEKRRSDGERNFLTRGSNGGEDFVNVARPGDEGYFFRRSVSEREKSQDLEREDAEKVRLFETNEDGDPSWLDV